MQEVRIDDTLVKVQLHPLDKFGKSIRVGHSDISRLTLAMLTRLNTTDSLVQFLATITAIDEEWSTPSITEWL
jgi:hypothetical protein